MTSKILHWLKIILFYFQQVGLEILLPLIIYLALKDTIGDINASLYMPVPNIISIIATLILYRIIEVLSIIIFIFYFFGSLTTYLLKNALWSQVASAGLNILIGVAFLTMEWFAPKPLTYYFGRPWFTKNQPELILWWNSRWGNPNFRTELKWNSYVWGIGWILIGVIGLALLFTINLDTAVILVLVVTIVGLIFMGAFTYFYAKIWQRREAKLAQNNNIQDKDGVIDAEIVV
ncbi:hypothetical protein CONCODRAFT_5475 [Conidiobolus coronatus NRRL 28638]|uniref:Uncharacterized protein n=1 Tax=Conidiobolus coronatus (strain ATCC 28846 / CBS 209.66 / NRRL 28638) TaxID=796925 RepID=A0A137P9T1_CONC2|nr:hypothetical protein CONCODRAFT_5475 [Conidiobolus coronatus NRRL 28638]|eukprot:KXN71766.1 hypothetical protein CONCODRAFT_5475 [Conidiobolus coronatus NRRL 28638]